MHGYFFEVEHLTMEQKRRLFYEAKNLSYDWRVDKLNCKYSFQRKKIEMPFESILKQFNENSLMIIKEDYDYLEEGYKFTVMFRKSAQIDLFLWLFIKKKVSEYLIKKYKLTIKHGYKYA